MLIELSRLQSGSSLASLRVPRQFECPDASRKVSRSAWFNIATLAIKWFSIQPYLRSRLNKATRTDRDRELITETHNPQTSTHLEQMAT